MRFLIVGILAAVAALPTRAQLTGCQYTTGPLQLSKVRSTAVGTQMWNCINDSFDRLSSSGTLNSTTSIATADWLRVRRISGVDVAPFGIRFSSPIWTSDGAYLRLMGSGTVEGTDGLWVFYGVRAGSAAIDGGLTASSGTFTGMGGVAATYGVTGATAQFSGALAAGNITASSGTFTATGNSQFSIEASSGMRINAGCYQFASGAKLCDTPEGGGDVASGGNNTFSGTNLHTGPETFTNIVWAAAPAWNGTNYLWRSSSGTVVYTTGTATVGGMSGAQTAVDSFHVAHSTFVLEGRLHRIDDTLFAIPRSSYGIVWITTHGVLQYSGMRDLKPSTISSFTASSTGILDGVVVALASSSANGDVHLFETVNRQPDASLFYSQIGNAIGAVPTTTNGNPPTPMYDCTLNVKSMMSCDTNTMEQMVVNPRFGRAYYGFTGNGSGTIQAAFTVHNSSGGASNILFLNYGAGTTWCVSVDGGAQTCNTNQQNSISVGTGYHTIMMTRAQSSNIEPFLFLLPPNMRNVRPGFW